MNRKESELTRVGNLTGNAIGTVIRKIKSIAAPLKYDAIP
jgi:hypothetical protein